MKIVQRPPYLTEPCLIEEIAVAVRTTRSNEAGGRIDKELRVRGLITSDCDVYAGSHCSNDIPLTCLQFLLASH
jgi:hypothetical protein